ncbi:hypothetical protein LCGC14_1477190 [marine sediment metagenome]|uniref:FeoB-associated Cys-rich membrane protein n=1 Tax=marine sediment metagenome TaxID=412755 RepID=A0A0F9JBC6_9ZZZZ
MWQIVIVVAIVLGAAAWLGYSIYRTLGRRGEGCCGCGPCPTDSPCDQADGSQQGQESQSGSA